MSNLDDDDSIKQFFNKVARNPHINYDERDWEKMEKMLDAENAREAAIRSARWRGAAIGFGLLSLALLIYFFVSRPDTSPSKEMAVENSAQTSDLNTSEKNDLIKSEESSTATIDPTLPKSLENKSALNNASTDVNSKPGELPDKRDRSSVLRKSPLIENDLNSFKADDSDFKAEDSEKESIASKTDSTQAIEQEESIGVNAVNPNDGALDSAINQQSQALAQSMSDSMEIKKDSAIVKSAKESDEQIEDIEKKKTLTYSRWSVSLAVAPDFSSTEIFQQASAGTAFGLTVQYEFYKRWSLQTGALFTNKKYWNMGDEYTNIRPGYWVARTNGVIPERIDGGCHVLEIPLALRYTMLNMKSNRIQVSAGVSSYIMVYETYHFTFEDPNPTATHDYKSSETNNYFLSMGSISLSYERMIHPKLAIGIEPYMKIPFAEIGWAKLPLYTTGAYLTLRYRFTN